MHLIFVISISCINNNHILVYYSYKSIYLTRFHNRSLVKHKTFGVQEC